MKQWFLILSNDDCTSMEYNRYASSRRDRLGGYCCQLSQSFIRSSIRFKEQSNSKGLLNYTNDTAVNSNGNTYVVDAYNDWIQIWSVNASSGSTVCQ